jgi:5-methylcytosine-specific restriction endonuclease McrA
LRHSKKYAWSREASKKEWNPNPNTPFGGKRFAYKEVHATVRWRSLRDKFIKLNPLCQSCLSKGITKAAQCVDHIKAIQDGGKAWDENNLQSLCNSCHSKKTSNEINERRRSKGGYRNPKT